MDAMSPRVNAHGPKCIASVQSLETSPIPHVWAPTRSQRALFSKAQLTARRRIAQALASSPDFRGSRLSRFQDCCSVPMLALKVDGTPTATVGICRDRLCPRCQRLRAIATTSRVIEAVSKMDAPRFLTLTLKHDHTRTLKATIEKLFDSFRRLRQDKRWKARVTAGVWVLEVTPGKSADGWHAHIHSVIDGTYYPQSELSIDWAKATGGSMIVDIRRVNSRSEAAKYIGAYVGKGNNIESWTDDQITDYAAGIFRRRTLGTFGKLFADLKHAVSDEPETIAARNICSIPQLIDRANGGNVHASVIVEYLARVNALTRRLIATTEETRPAAPPLAEWERERLYAFVMFYTGCSLTDPQHAWRSDGTPVKVDVQGRVIEATLFSDA